MDRGEKPYRCLAECGASFGSGNARKLHCIAKHNFPRNFDFEGLLGAVAAPPSSRAARGGGGKDDGGKRRQKQPLTEEERAAREEAIKASGAVCRYYYTPGGCRRGKACFFRHDAEGEGEGEGEGSEVDVDRLGEALDRRLKLEHARSVSFGRQARGRSKRLGRALPPQGGGGGEG